jgi:hypothetical protein
MKKIYFFTLLNLIFNNMDSQTFSWAKDEGLWAYDYGMGITNDNSGNIYVAGKYEMKAIFSGDTLPCVGVPDCNHDAFIAKYNQTGALTWIKTAGGKNGDYAHAVACDGTKYVYVAGEIEGYRDLGDLITFPGSTITLSPVGDNDILLAKYDLSGNLIWARNDGGYYSEKAEGVTYDKAGNIFICGHYADTALFGVSTTLYGSGIADVFVAKYDSSGNFKWVRKIGGPGRDEAKSIKCDTAGNIYVCGFYSNGAVFGTQTFSTTGGAYVDTYIAKYSNSGSLLWVKTAGGNYDDAALSLTTDNAGLIYITGEFNAAAYFGTTQLITSGNADIFVACYDTSGNEKWAKSAGGPLIDRARGIGCNGNNIYITGQFGDTASIGSFKLYAADSSDVFFASLNNAGTFLAASSVGGIADSFEPLGYESGNAICADSLGNAYATGGLLNGGNFGSTTVTPYGRTDVFITKISRLVSVNTVVNTLQKNIHIYPNPGNGNFTIDLAQTVNQKIDISIYNCLGQTIEAKTNRLSSKINVDLSSADDGMYFIEIKGDDKTITTKKIVVHK